MKKSFLITSIVGTGALISTIAISSIGGVKSFLKTMANTGSANTLNLSDQKLSTSTSSYTGEQTATVYTNNHNELSFKCANVINNNSGWQTILPGGYFYNPLTNSSTHNKINGIESVRFNSAGSANLSLSYGYTLDDSNVIYSYEKTLSPNTTFDLEGLNPTYVYIKNNGNSNVEISSFVVNYSCQESEYPNQDLNVLMIGNSFADDTLFYTERAAASYGINLHLYDAYIASCTIDMHYSNLTNNSATYSMRNIANNTWNYQNEMTLTQIINSKTWDIITFQQASASVGRSNSYGNLSNFANAVRNLVGSAPKFYWYQTWAYDKEYQDPNDAFSYFDNNQLTMFNAINSCYSSQVAPLGLFSKLISAGTAVQNMRTSYMKDTISRDLKHMSSVHGRFLLGLNFLSQVYDIDFEKSPCSYLPNEVDSTYKTVAYESIKNAVKSPLNCTNSLYPVRELAGYNLSNYTEIDAELLGCSYWNSTDSSNYNKRIANASGTSIKYATTKRFTQSELPIGSLVVIGDAFGVRPEAWASDAVQGSRPAETYANVIEVNSSFWSGYQYRAFNIFKPGETGPLALTGQFNQIFDGFHVYVPNSYSPTAKTNNPYLTSDTHIMYHYGLDMNSYERLHLDPITGFYKCDSYYELTNSYSDDTAKKFVCTRPFYSANDDLPNNTIIICDEGYQWRSDCLDAEGTYSPRPNNVSSELTRLNSSFWSGFRRRTFNISKTNSGYVNQDHISFMNHMRIYVPTTDDVIIEKDNYPEGTFRGDAVVNSATFSIVLAIGTRSNGLVAVSLANKDAVATGITFNNSTNKVTITTTGSYSGLKYGTITGTYDAANDRITGISCSGAIKSYVSNNGSITATKPSTYFDCDGTTRMLQAQFKRRYNSGGWSVDSSNADRFLCDDSHYVSGKGAMSVRPCGTSFEAYALNLNADLSPTITAKNIGFWVYNQGNDDVIFREWVFAASGLTSGQEFGSLTAKANSWTYCAMGFNQTIVYNFQISVWKSNTTQNTATAMSTRLTFDNIVLFL